MSVHYFHVWTQLGGGWEEEVKANEEEGKQSDSGLKIYPWHVLPSKNSNPEDYLGYSILQLQ